MRHFAQRYGLKVIRQEQLGDFWDALGTLIGSLGMDEFTRTQSADGDRRVAFSRRNLGLLLTKLARRACLAFIPQGKLRRVFSLGAPICITNFAVMERL